MPREGQHQPARVLFGNKNGQSTLSRFSIRLVSVARSALSGGTRCRRAFSVTSIDEKGTTKDAKRRAPRRGATRREKVDREATRRKRAYFSATFFRARRKGNDETRAWHTRSETSRRFWVGIPGVSGPLVSGADLFLLSLSLSLLHRRALQKHTDWENQNHAPAAEGNREIRVLHPRLVGLRRRLIRRVVVHLGANAPV